MLIVSYFNFFLNWSVIFGFFQGRIPAESKSFKLDLDSVAIDG